MGTDPADHGPHVPLTRRTLLTGALAASTAGAVGALRPAQALARQTASRATRTQAQARAQAAEAQAQPSASVAFDRYSLLVGGRRLVVWSGEFHPFRLPSPPLWRDVLQKMKASGYNAVCMYFNWSYHSAAPGRYDFTGVRDMDLALDMAADTGLYVLTRPGPYINAEVNAGGFPGWLTITEGLARSDDPNYLGHADEWLTAINAVIARHQVTDGRGTVLLYQIENEYASHLTSPTGINYMAHLYAKARADGITVPIYHNDKGRNADWNPGSFPGSEAGYLYAFDGYPSASGAPPDWGYFGTVGSKASPATPGFEAEFGGGFFDPWGGAPWHGQGYGFERGFDGPAYERTFYLTNLANGIKIHNVYMTFGGTSWGWLPAPVVYTSYDYGAAISEARQLTAKIPPMQQIGYFLATVADLAKLDPADPPATSNPLVKAYHLTNPDTGSHFYFLRNDHTADLTFTVTLAEGTVPLELNGKDMKVIAASYQAESQYLVYTTSHLVTHAAHRDADVILLAGRPGQAGQTVLRYPAQPNVTGLPGATWDPATGRLTLDYTHEGLAEVTIIPAAGHPAPAPASPSPASALATGNRASAAAMGKPALLLIADDTAAAAFWRLDTGRGVVLAHGPALVRTARLRGELLELTGDTAAPTPLRVWAPGAARRLTWNGRPLPWNGHPGGPGVTLPGPPPVTLPPLGPWRYAPENPESAPDFDDSDWAVADKTSSHSVTPVPPGQPVLFADDYGFHYGDVWYRGSWSGTTDITSISLGYSSGQEGLLLAWLDGQFLGSHQMPVPTTAQATTQTWTATVTLPAPAAQPGPAQPGPSQPSPSPASPSPAGPSPAGPSPAGPSQPGQHVLAVLVRPMSHPEDGGANDAFKTALGLTRVTFAGASPSVTWRIQGSTGSDPVRGPLNAGGLYGERHGWSEPGFPDRSWAAVTLPHADPRPGVAWYRTRFRLAIPDGVDASLGLAITDDPTRAYRALIFVNGWNLGQYINGVGPQTTFVLPTGILNPHGDNTLAIAVTSGGLPAGGTSTAATVTGGLGAAALLDIAIVAGGACI